MPPPLDQAQRWLLDAIVSASAPTAADTQSWLTPGPAQTPDERLAVYRHAYLARLVEVLRELFPCTRFAAGDDLFDRLMVDYVRANPPSSYTLAKLHDKLVAFLDASRPPDWGQFLVELAHLEHAIDQVFDGLGGENLPPFHLPAEATADLRLNLTPGFTLLAFNYPISAFYSAWKAGHRPQWPTPQAQHLALLRRDYIVRRYELSPEQYEILRCLQTGMTIAEAIACLATAGHSTDLLAPQLASWFERWGAESFFCSAG